MPFFLPTTRARSLSRLCVFGAVPKRMLVGCLTLRAAIRLVTALELRSRVHAGVDEQRDALKRGNGRSRIKEVLPLIETLVGAGVALLILWLVVRGVES